MAKALHIVDRNGRGFQVWPFSGRTLFLTEHTFSAVKNGAFVRDDETDELRPATPAEILAVLMPGTTMQTGERE